VDSDGFTTVTHEKKYTQVTPATDLMMKTASTSETLVNFYQTTRHNNPEDSHIHKYAFQE
jgi:hypothetical protein